MVDRVVALHQAGRRDERIEAVAGRLDLRL